MFRQSYLKSIIVDFNLYITDNCEIKSSVIDEDNNLIIYLDKKSEYKQLEIKIKDYRHIKPNDNCFVANKFCGNICVSLNFFTKGFNGCGWIEVFTYIENIINNLIQRNLLQKKKIKFIQLDIFDYLEGNLK